MRPCPTLAAPLLVLASALSASAAPPAPPNGAPAPAAPRAGRPDRAPAAPGTVPEDAPAAPPAGTERAPSAPQAPASAAPEPADAAPATNPDSAPAEEPVPREAHEAAGEPEPSPPGAASARELPKKSPPPEEEPPRRTARDTVGGHLAVGANAALFVPFGSFQAGSPQSDLLGSGPLFGGDITYGVSRTVMVGAYGEVAMPSGEGGWSGQSVTALAAGPLVRYHLAQGTRFDPWLSYGIGFRRLSEGSHSLTGLDWARLQVGGDWYAFSQLGFGPYAELALGTYLSSSDSLGDKAVNAHFALGVRVVYDGPGK